MTLLIAPIEALIDKRLNDPERRVLLSLYSFRNKNADTVWPSIVALAERANIKDHTRISKITSSLSEKGWLTKKRRGFTGGNEYRLTVPARLEEQSNLGSDTKLDSETNLESDANLGGETNSKLDSETNSNLDSDTKYKEHQIEHQSEHQNTMGDSGIEPGIDESKTDTPPPDAKPSKPQPVEFERFWEIYPRKTNKSKAKQAWEKIKPGEELFDLIAENIRARIACGEWAESRKEFIPHGSTYLNQARWEDEVIPRGQSDATGQPNSQPRSEVERVDAELRRRSRERENLSGGRDAPDDPGDPVASHDGAVRLQVDPGLRGEPDAGMGDGAGWPDTGQHQAGTGTHGR